MGILNDLVKMLEQEQNKEKGEDENGNKRR